MKDGTGEAGMRTLSSKRFFIPKAFTVSWNSVKEWYDGVDRGMDDCTLVVALQAMDGKRSGKKAAYDRLDELMEGGGNDFSWERYGYRFCFVSRKYYWNDREIYVTANEALFLYRRLVLKDDTCKTQMYYLRNMRKRLGKEFLREAVQK
jgi:hypothetical protein